MSKKCSTKKPRYPHRLAAMRAISKTRRKPMSRDMLRPDECSECGGYHIVTILR